MLSSVYTHSASGSSLLSLGFLPLAYWPTLYPGNSEINILFCFTSQNLQRLQEKPAFLNLALRLQALPQLKPMARLSVLTGRETEAIDKEPVLYQGGRQTEAELLRKEE